MTELLERAIARLKTWPASEQNAIASIILEELEDELRWDEAFSHSENVLLPNLQLQPWLSTTQIKPKSWTRTGSKADTGCLSPVYQRYFS